MQERRESEVQRCAETWGGGEILESRSRMTNARPRSSLSVVRAADAQGWQIASLRLTRATRFAQALSVPHTHTHTTHNTHLHSNFPIVSPRPPLALWIALAPWIRVLSLASMVEAFRDARAHSRLRLPRFPIFELGAKIEKKKKSSFYGKRKKKKTASRPEKDVSACLAHRPAVSLGLVTGTHLSRKLPRCPSRPREARQAWPPCSVSFERAVCLAVIRLSGSVRVCLRAAIDKHREAERRCRLVCC
jgi:hypothetical protein